MTRAISACIAAAAAFLWAAPAQADELFGGLYVHDVDTFLTKSGVEDGVDVHLGWRSEPMKIFRLQQHFFFSLNSAGDTHFAAWGISRKFGDKIYVRPGVGVAIHTGSHAEFDNPDNDRIEFGSRFLFEPELAVGARINERMSVEASWVHLSHGLLASDQNPGIDNIGVRLNYRL